MSRAIIGVTAALREVTPLLSLSPRELRERFKDDSRCAEDQARWAKETYCLLQDTLNDLVDARNKLIELSSYEVQVQVGFKPREEVPLPLEEDD